MGPESAVTHVLDEIARIALTWLPLLMICLIVYLLWRMVQLMPRVKPAQIQPAAGGTPDFLIHAFHKDKF